MKNIISLLLFALIALAMTGCVEDRPPARLDSPDRNERIEAVREARNKYGSPAPVPTPVSEPANTPLPVITLPRLSIGDAPAADHQAIVGRWYREGKKDAYFQFDADGTFKDEVELNTTTGRWRFVSADTIELSALKYSNLLLFWAPSRTNIEYRLQDNELWVKGVYTSSEWVGFVRATGKEKQP